MDTLWDAFFTGRAREIEQHMILNPGDWSVEHLFEQIGALSCSRDRFARLIEAALHPLGRRGPKQAALAEEINAVLRRDGYELALAGEESGYPIFDTGGEFAGCYAAITATGLRAANREQRVGALPRPAHHSPSRMRLMATAVTMCCRWVLARPR